MSRKQPTPVNKELIKPVPPPPPPRDKVKLYDDPLIEYERLNIIRILGVPYTVEFFESFAEGGIGCVFKIIRRDEDGAVTIETMEEAE